MTEVTSVPKKVKGRKAAKPAWDKEVATRLHSKIVRSIGVCEAAGMFGIECYGEHQCAHVIPREFATTRTDLTNGRCLCIKHHGFVDDFPAYMAELVGREVYDALRVKAQRGVREFAGLTPTMWWRSERERMTEIARAKGISL